MGVLGQALTDYMSGQDKGRLMVACDRAPLEVMDMATFFLAEPEMAALDRAALALCRGHVLDLGAGAGRHSLALLQRGLHADALEADPGLCALMLGRGVQAVHPVLWQDFAPQAPYDTVLALMNGIGLCANHAGLPAYLDMVRSWLAPGGQFLVDSASVSYLPLAKDRSRRADEVMFQFRYDNQVGEWFSWLFAEAKPLIRAMTQAGFKAQIIHKEAGDRFLVQAIRL